VKLGILGGSFNPVHLGHLFLADKVICALNLDRVVFVPAFRSPFKLSEGIEDNADDRLDMLAAAVAGDSRFAIDDCEIRREGVSYTVDTIQDIIARYLPDGKPALIIGDDLALDFPKWHESERILHLADIVIARRIESKGYDYPHTLIDNEVINISSQTVRRKIDEGSDWRSLVPSAAAAIIEDRQLYGLKSSFYSVCSRAALRRIEAAVQEALSTERFLHSRNTALLASDMCRRFGLDPMAGYLAGITHDLAKELDNKQIIKLIKNSALEISPLEKDKPNLMHGKAAAILLEERFCIHNKDVLDAVAFHTSGSESMKALAKIIYIADKTESSRNIDPALRKMCMEADLDTIFFAVLEKTVGKLRARKLDLSEDTILLLNKIQSKE